MHKVQKAIKKIIRDNINNHRVKKINNKMMADINNNIIPVVVDCELNTLNQYIHPVLDELTKSKDYKFNFYFAEELPGFGSSLPLYSKAKTFSTSQYEKIKNAEIFISPHIYPKGPSNSLKIFFDHAICSAKFSHHPLNYYHNYDIIFVTGEINKNKLSKILNRFNLSDKVKLINGGYPKFDSLFNTPKEKSAILDKLNLDKNNKTILYAPSWEDGLSLREFGTKLLKTILDENKYNVIIKPHPCSLTTIDNPNYGFYTGDVNWRSELKKISNASNCAFVEDFNIDDLLIAADVMITDLSSVALEFLVLDKPVLYLDCPQFEKTYKSTYTEFNNTTYSELLNDPYSNAGRHVGLITYNYKDINRDIEFILTNPEYKKTERDKFANRLLVNKGTAGEICANKIIEQWSKKCLNTQ